MSESGSTTADDKQAQLKESLKLEKQKCKVLKDALKAEKNGHQSLQEEYK